MAVAFAGGNSGMALLWLGLHVSIAAHEAGHALAARWLRLGVDKVGVGVGPVLIISRIDLAPISIRALPLVGWVEVPHVAAQRWGTHRRRCWLALAGPLASLLLAILAVAGAMLLAGRPASEPGELATATATDIVDVALGTPTAIVSGIVGLPAQVIDVVTDDKPASDGSTAGEGSTAGDGPDDEESDGDLVSVIGMTAHSASAESDDLAGCLYAFGLLSASIGGFNLLPAFGLDGHHVLASVAQGLSRRDNRLRFLESLVSALSVVLGAGLVLVVARTMLADVLHLL